MRVSLSFQEKGPTLWTPHCHLPIPGASALRPSCPSSRLPGTEAEGVDKRHLDQVPRDENRIWQPCVLHNWESVAQASLSPQIQAARTPADRPKQRKGLSGYPFHPTTTSWERVFTSLICPVKQITTAAPSPTWECLSSPQNSYTQSQWQLTILIELLSFSTSKCLCLFPNYRKMLHVYKSNLKSTDMSKAERKHFLKSPISENNESKYFSIYLFRIFSKHIHCLSTRAKKMHIVTFYYNENCEATSLCTGQNNNTF